MNYKLRVKPQQIIIVCKYTIVEIGVVKCLLFIFLTPDPLEGRKRKHLFLQW
jgi:hypothetical protein